ncbi:MAG: transcriptional regulator [Treponema sp.]|jgi:hypothetical protein|nr:transcriptional regulator [Treponema sp.]
MGASDIAKVQANEDFNRARSRELFSRIGSFINSDRNKLLSFNDVKDILKPSSQVYLGMRTVPINRIVGSEGRYNDFNKHFLPRKEFLRNRWMRVDMASIQDLNLPPIQLYEIGGAYFVRDGNHRVSVAKLQGVENIDAEVISLSTEIHIPPNATAEELNKALLEYEKKIFYEKTRFEELTGDGDLEFTSTGRYDVIYNHILVHKYFLNEEKEEEIPFSDALVSWYKNVYQPTIQIIEENNMLVSFPGRKPADLYVWIIKHWDFLKKKYGCYDLRDAARDFVSKYGEDDFFFFRMIAFIVGKFFGRFGKIFRKKGKK